MNPQYNQNYTRKEINKILSDIKKCVADGNYQISLNENRQENIDFINEYNIRDSKQRAILSQLMIEDFCYSVKNRNSDFPDETLYIFAPTVQLFTADDMVENVVMYIKINLIRQNEDFAIVISFHKLNAPIRYLFK